MVLYRNLYIPLQLYTRRYAIRVMSRIEVDENILKNIKTEGYKPKHHPGIIRPNTISLPTYIVQAITNIIQDYPEKLLLIDSDALARRLRYRVSAMETPELNAMRQNITQSVLIKEKSIEITNESDEHRIKQKVTDKIKDIMKQKVYNWSPINYNSYNSLLYLFTRSAPEYAVLAKIFAEINLRDPNFKPRSLFDFGSGIGTVTWAAKSYWKESIFEYFNVDISGDMNDLAQTVLQAGGNSSNNNLKGYFYRQFLPASNTTYDLVVSAFSLMELPSCQARIETILKLWNKTNKYLIIVEQGSNAGFKIINEMRDYLLYSRNDTNMMHIFSPCPHDSPCPRFLNDNTPCNFEVGYTKPYGRDTTVLKERYCYIVLKRGERNAIEEEWPRIVRQPLVRSKHTVCRMCTANGKLTEIIFTASKHGKSTYHCARASKWGDRLPITLEGKEDEIG